MQPVAALLTVWTLLGLAGCEPPDDPEAGCDRGPGAVEVGQVVGTTLTPLPPEGGELTIVRGPQGGIHVLVGAWVDGLELDLTLTYRLTDPTTGALVGDETVLELRPSLFDRTGPRPERSPDLLILDNTSAPVDDYTGREVTLEAEARDASGNRACDSRQVTLVGT